VDRASISLRKPGLRALLATSLLAVIAVTWTVVNRHDGSLDIPRSWKPYHTTAVSLRYPPTWVHRSVAIPKTCSEGSGQLLINQPSMRGLATAAVCRRQLRSWPGGERVAAVVIRSIPPELLEIVNVLGTGEKASPITQFPLSADDAQPGPAIPTEGHGRVGTSSLLVRSGGTYFEIDLDYGSDARSEDIDALWRIVGSIRFH
jgi:hypothetical protein